MHAARFQRTGFTHTVQFRKMCLTVSWWWPPREGAGMAAAVTVQSQGAAGVQRARARARLTGGRVHQRESDRAGLRRRARRLDTFLDIHILK
jgi:hypothetical protein